MLPWHWQRLHWHARLNQICNFSSALTLAPWWRFLHEPKHVGADFTILIVFNSSTILYNWVH
jgi:hypothetical protein